VRTAPGAVAPAHVQVITPDSPICGDVQTAPAPADNELKRKSGLRVIVIDRFSASLGPRLVLVAVNVTGTLRSVVVVDATKVNARLAEVTTVVVVVAVFGTLGSGVAAVAVAVAVITVVFGVAAATRTTMVAAREPPRSHRSDRRSIRLRYR